MNDFVPWTQSDWYAAGNLLIRLGFLAATVWFARNFLKTMRVFQEQIGALLKLSITSSAEGISPSAIAARSLGESSPYWLPVQETRPSAILEPMEGRSNGLFAAWHGLIHWLNEPMSASRISHWRRMINWLQAPAGS